MWLLLALTLIPSVCIAQPAIRSSLYPAAQLSWQTVKLDGSGNVHALLGLRPSSSYEVRLSFPGYVSAGCIRPCARASAATIEL